VHGATGNHALRALATGVEACFTVTLVDGLVLARSTFHHSINYRSVVLFALGERVDDNAEKAEVMRRLVEHLVPGRTADAREADPGELRETLVVRLPIHEASAKIRTGGPIDDEGDLSLPVWAGIVPLQQQAADPIADQALDPDIPVPDYVKAYRR
jgi:nitroimidazol reductase NimA-like FMN-containing flavoprotein (pyridoxamine 5'-phosphate oxidase superfamily)